MAYPPKYDRQFSFTDDEIEHPSAKTPGDELDGEFDALKSVTDAIIEASKLIQRSDGKLQNGIVGRAQLSPGLQVGVDPARAWVTGTAYAAADAVTKDNGLYTCLVAHAAGVFADDLAASKWELLANYSSTTVAPGSITSTEIANAAVIEGKLAGNSVSTAKIQNTAVTEVKIANDAVTTAKIAGNAVTAAKIPDRELTFAKLPEVVNARLLGRVTTGDGDMEPIELGDGLKFSGGKLTLDFATQSDAQAQTSQNDTRPMTALRVWQMILSIFPIGTPLHWPASTPPSGWLACDGSEVSRATYSALFAAIGTTFGAGDGSTTFNLPNEEGAFRRGWASGGTRDPGRVFGSFQDDEFEAHTHADYGIGATVQTAATTVRSSTATQSGTTGSAGGAETRPKNIAYLPIIRYR